MRRMPCAEDSLREEKIKRLFRYASDSGPFLPPKKWSLRIDSCNMHVWNTWAARAELRRIQQDFDVKVRSRGRVKDSWSGHWIMRRCSGSQSQRWNKCGSQRIRITGDTSLFVSSSPPHPPTHSPSLLLSCSWFPINILSPETTTASWLIQEMEREKEGKNLELEHERVVWWTVPVLAKHEQQDTQSVFFSSSSLVSIGRRFLGFDWNRLLTSKSEPVLIHTGYQI